MAEFGNLPTSEASRVLQGLIEQGLISPQPQYPFAPKQGWGTFPEGALEAPPTQTQIAPPIGPAQVGAQAPLPLSPGMPPTITPPGMAPSAPSGPPQMGGLGPQSESGFNPEMVLQQLMGMMANQPAPSPLQLLAASWSGKTSPWEIVAQHRQQQLQGLLHGAQFGMSVVELRRKQKEREEDLKEKGITHRLDMAKVFINSEDEQTRLYGYQTYESMGMIPQGAAQQLADDPTYGFGKTDAGILTKAAIRDRLAKGEKVDPKSIFLESVQEVQKKSIVERYADDILSDPNNQMNHREALLRAQEDMALAGSSSIESRVLKLEKEGKSGEAARLLQIRKEVAEAGAVRPAPNTTPTVALEKLSMLRANATGLKRIIDLFDPTDVGVLGKLKGLSTRLSDFGTKAYPTRNAFRARLSALMADYRREAQGTTQSIGEMQAALEFLPNLQEDLSVAETVLKLDAYAERVAGLLRTYPDMYREGGYPVPSLERYAKELDEVRARLRPYIDLAPEISKSTYDALRSGIGGPARSEAEIRSQYRSDGTW